MTPTIESITTTALTLALDAASLRQQAISTNIANVNTPGYAPMAVSFEDQLEDAKQALQATGRLDAASLAGVRPVLHETTGAGGIAPKVLLDVEAANLAQNAVHFQALLKGLSKHMALLSSATSDGKK
ncbi:MAG TPA: flagellar basal body rod protein FlgB [Burkholderiaceae bacterium]|nr:flagellar basal body rod protein FlgB [Burkholderiaceae bacterium]